MRYLWTIVSLLLVAGCYPAQPASPVTGSDDPFYQENPPRLPGKPTHPIVANPIIIVPAAPDGAVAAPPCYEQQGGAAVFRKPPCSP